MFRVKRTNPKLKIDGITIGNNYIKTDAPKFRSNYEAMMDVELKKMPIKYSFESETIPYMLDGKRHLYHPDFIINGKRGKKYYIEAKGPFDIKMLRKYKAVVEQNKGMRDNFVIIFQQNMPMNFEHMDIYDKKSKRVKHSQLKEVKVRNKRAKIDYITICEINGIKCGVYSDFKKILKNEFKL